MKLSQAILISLTLLICFSPTLSLAMEHVIDINDQAAQRDALVVRLKSKNIKLFRSINDPIKYNCSDLCKKIFKCCCCVICQFKNVFFCITCCCATSKNFIFRVGCYCVILSWLLIFFLLNDKVGQVILLSFFTGMFVLLCAHCCVHCCVDDYTIDVDCNPIEYEDDHFLVDIHCNDISNIRYMLKDIDHFKAINFLQYAIKYELPDDIIEILFDKGGRFNQETFGEVIKKCSFAMVKLLVDLGIDVNVKDGYGTPTIITAMLNKKLKVINLLLSKNVDLNIENAQGKTAIDYLNNLPEADKQIIKEKFKKFRQRIAQQIYNDLEKFKFPQDHADLISEYLV